MSTQPGKNNGRAGSDSGEAPSDETKKKVSDDTVHDLEMVTEDSAKDAEATSTDLKKPETSESSSTEIAPVKDTAAKPSASGAASASRSSKEQPSWAKPAEPAGSVSAGRTENSSKPFGRREVSGGGAPAAGSGYTGTAVKDRPAVSSPVPATASSSAKPPANGKPARKAQLQLARLEPWSVMKFSFVMSLVCFVVLLVAVTVLYMILSGLGVFDSISDTINDLTRRPDDTTSTMDAGSWFSFARVFGYTVLVGALNVLLITALSTVGSIIYNLAADLVGGVEVTLKEAE
ncbi:DUF3566 domain-containing protein [Spirillospora sp. CA-294931]|uniref:DUF3566 domain-containing protein n=1 Tax=Spirillospora sp. CA-294931 TaxID=3240042 RepID=UPI003D9304BC